MRGDVDTSPGPAYAPIGRRHQLPDSQKHSAKTGSSADNRLTPMAMAQSAALNQYSLTLYLVNGLDKLQSPTCSYNSMALPKSPMSALSSAANWKHWLAVLSERKETPQPCRRVRRKTGGDRTRWLLLACTTRRLSRSYPELWRRPGCPERRLERSTRGFPVQDQRSAPIQECDGRRMVRVTYLFLPVGGLAE